MSLNISERILAISEKVELTINFNKFGKVQHKNFLRMLKTGVIEGNGAPAQVATRILKFHQQPRIHIDTYGISWVNLPKESLVVFEDIRSAIMFASSSAWLDYAKNSIRIFNNIENALDDGYLGTYIFRNYDAIRTTSLTPKIIQQKFREIQLSPSETLSQLITAIENGTVTKYTILL